MSSTIFLSFSRLFLLRGGFLCSQKSLMQVYDLREHKNYRKINAFSAATGKGFYCCVKHNDLLWFPIIILVIGNCKAIRLRNEAHFSRKHIICSAKAFFTATKTFKSENEIWKSADKASWKINAFFPLRKVLHCTTETFNQKSLLRSHEWSWWEIKAEENKMKKNGKTKETANHILIRAITKLSDRNEMAMDIEQLS